MAKIMYNGKNYSMGVGAEPDNKLNEFSENPIQNKVVTEALNNKLNISDISEWAKAETKPEYTPEEVGADEKGSADTALNSAKNYVDGKISDLINGAPETLDTLKEVANAIEENETVVEALNTAVGTKANSSDLIAHTGNTSNPHETTKDQVGLSNVPNVSTNDQTPTYSDTTTFATLSSGEKISVAFAKIKLAITNLINHVANKNNPHEVTKTQLGLGNVENKSSSTIRGELTKENVTTALGYTPPTTNTTYSTVTTSVNGLMSSNDKSKLDGIASGANAYSLPTATSSVLGGVKTGTNITNNSGTISITKDNVTSALGYTPPTTNTTYSVATTTANGLMSSTDKSKLDGIASGANNYTHPAYTAKASGLYKVTVDATGHVSATTAVTKDDITALGIPAQDTNTTYSAATTTTNGLMSSTDKNRLDNLYSKVSYKLLSGYVSTTTTAKEQFTINFSTPFSQEVQAILLTKVLTGEPISSADWFVGVKDVTKSNFTITKYAGLEARRIIGIYWIAIGI